MCDTIAGELLVSFHRDDPAATRVIELIAEGAIEHVEVLARLKDRLSDLDLPIREGLELEFYRIRVPVGEEAFKINYLQFYYKHALLEAMAQRRFFMREVNRRILSDSNLHFQVVPHSWLSVAGAGAASRGFTQTHREYKALLGIDPAASTGSAATVLVLDTGYDASQELNVRQEKNFVDPSRSNVAVDDHGHGTAVATLIQDVCPAADLHVFKVADKDGRASEWDLLAALAAWTGAQVVNISLSFGLGERECPHCGRESHSSRSAVFENMLQQVSRSASAPVLVAAAGNDGASELAFPARFADVVAIASVDSSLRLSEFSNYGTIAAGGAPHPYVFVLPGGQQTEDDPPTEFVISSASGEQYYGTSFAAAYASGVIAALAGSPEHAPVDRQGLLDLLCTRADQQMETYDPSTYGNGLMKC